MPNIHEDAKRWQIEMSSRVGRAVQLARKAAGWSALELSAKCDELGYPISRVAISKIESNSRAGKLDLAELIVLATALNTSPVNLVYPGPYDSPIEFLPGYTDLQFHAAQWFSGLQAMMSLVGIRIPSKDGPSATRYESGSWEDWFARTDELNDWRGLSSLHELRAGLLEAGKSGLAQLKVVDDQIRTAERQIAERYGRDA